MHKRNTLSIEDQTIPLKYGRLVNDEYQEKKMEIKLEKAKDIYSMRIYCEKLSKIEDLEYWYPMPNGNQVETEDIITEELNQQFDWLEKRIVSNEFEEELLNQLFPAMEYELLRSNED